MSAAIVTGYGTPTPDVRGNVEYGGSVSVDLPDGVTARIVGNAVVIDGTYEGVQAFFRRCHALSFRLHVENVRRLLWPS